MNVFKRFKTFNPLLLFIAIIFFMIYNRHERVSVATGEIRKVVSLSPAITREIIDLESEYLLVGVTEYHPPLSRKIDIVGNLIQPNIEKIISLNPDIVMLSNEDNPIQSVERLDATGIRTHSFGRNEDFEEICSNYLKLATLIGKRELARSKLTEYRNTLRAIRHNETRLSIALFIDHSSLIAASGNSYVGKIIKDAGGSNCLEGFEVPYPIVSEEFIVTCNPDIIISIREGSENYFKRIFSDFPFITAIKNDTIYSIRPDRVAFYTPGDYVSSVQEIAEIIRKELLRRNRSRTISLRDTTVR